MDDDIFTSKWTWIALLAAFILLSVAIVYAFSTHRPVRIGTDDKMLSLNNPKYNLDASPYAYPPPKMAFQPWEDKTATPKPKPEPKKVSHPLKVIHKEAVPSPVKDMFPMGRIAEAPQAEPPPQRDPEPEESYPTVTCGGKEYRSTGGFAAASQLDLVPSSCSLGDRTLYALAGSGDSPGVLFARSLNDPDKYAVYR